MDGPWEGPIENKGWIDILDESQSMWRETVSGSVKLIIILSTVLTIVRNYLIFDGNVRNQF